MFKPYCCLLASYELQICCWWLVAGAVPVAGCMLAAAGVDWTAALFQHLGPAYLAAFMQTTGAQVVKTRCSNQVMTAGRNWQYCKAAAY